MNKPIKPLPDGNKLAKLAPIYLKRWENLKRYPEQEKALNKLFGSWPTNDDFDWVMVKIATLDKFYSTRLNYIVDIANCIRSMQDFDNSLKNGDLKLVDEIKVEDIKVDKITVKKFSYKPFSFASKYCSFHNPDKYPIYDKFVALVLTYYHKKENYLEGKERLLQAWESARKAKDKGNTKNYEEALKCSYKDLFYPIIKEFQEYYKLIDYSFKELDRFLWLFGKEYFGGQFDDTTYKSAKFGDYDINIEKLGSVLVYKNSKLLSNSKDALREIVKLIDELNWNPNWNTRQAGRIISKYINEHP